MVAFDGHPIDETYPTSKVKIRPRPDRRCVDLPHEPERRRQTPKLDRAPLLRTHPDWLLLMQHEG